MASVSYQKKLSRQFTRYAAGMVLVFFLSFTILLLVYTLGINRYRNNKCNDLVAASFSRSYDQYTEFLCSPEAQELFLRRLAGEIRKALDDLETYLREDRLLLQQFLSDHWYDQRPHSFRCRGDHFVFQCGRRNAWHPSELL